ncbi:type VII secretion protein EssA [Sporosarcina sp. ANT_H38]|uniref:type VII secretion protein EssA n=1 Tax=Sporosarcina sp. ANT_H38 TaxID=2597358 RepID=UPI0011F35354|nr:type VII secretion protein EssA [Sporosarcina sp. ANT_H38]KAA0955569.1 type VII secretion protein EssA [Sporosarcina sp. ANT_H38]
MKTKSTCLLLVVLVIAWIAGGIAVQAAVDDEPNLDLEPLSYEKLKFKKNTDYLHDSKKVEMKNTIPVKQFDIYFDGRKQLPKRSNGSYLFQTAARGEKSTVAAKTSELGLFTNAATSSKEITADNIVEENTAPNMSRTLILLAIIVAGLVTLFTIFLPKLVNTSEGDKRNPQSDKLIE